MRSGDNLGARGKISRRECRRKDLNTQLRCRQETDIQSQSRWMNEILFDAGKTDAAAGHVKKDDNPGGDYDQKVSTTSTLNRLPKVATVH